MKNKRILIVEVNWLGDVLFSTPTICALKTQYPQSYIGVLVHKRCKDVLVGNPYVNEIIILDEQNKHKGLWGKLRLIGQLKVKKFDTVYLFHRSFTRALICFLSGISNRIGYYTAKRRLLLTESVLAPKEVMHRAAYYYYLVARNIPSLEDLRCDFFITDSDVSYIDSILKQEGVAENKRIVVMHPVANWLPKRWPKENFSKLADRLIDKFGVIIVFCAAPQEQNIIVDILNLMKNKAINLSAKTSLKQLGALFKKADLVISADSGPLHISVALDRPTVAIFGPTSKAITGPLTKQNIIILQKQIDGCVIPCYRQDCLDNRCMKQISVEDVINCIEEKRWLASNK